MPPSPTGTPSARPPCEAGAVGLLLLGTDGRWAAAEGTFRLHAREVLPAWAEPRRVCTWELRVRLRGIRAREGPRGLVGSQGWPCQSGLLPSLVFPPSDLVLPSHPRREVPQLAALLGRLSQILLQEGHRLKAWGVLGTGTGAELLRPGEPCWTQPGPPPSPRKPGPVSGGRKAGGRLNREEIPKLGRGFLCSGLGKRLLPKREPPPGEQQRRRPTKPPQT